MKNLKDKLYSQVRNKINILIHKQISGNVYRKSYWGNYRNVLWKVHLQARNNIKDDLDNEKS